MCILISSVGEKGMTLMATNHMVILDSIPNVSLLKQIVARVARHSTHKALPPDKQWVTISVMAISPPTKSKIPYSREEFRYFLRELNDKYVGTLWRPVQRNATNCPLLTDFGPRAGFGKGDWESGEIVCKYKIPSLNKSSIPSYTANYYQADVQAASTVILHVLNSTSPALTLSKMEEIIWSNTVRIVPWNTSFISKEAIADALRGLVKDRRVEMLTSRSTRAKMKTRGGVEQIVETDPIIARFTPGGIRALNIVTRSHMASAGIWIPAISDLTVNTSISPLIEQMAQRRGIREKQILMDSLLSRRGHEETLHRQFVNRGPVYDLLFQLGMIIWEGDNISVDRYGKNRLIIMDGVAALESNESGELSTAKTGIANRAIAAMKALVPIGFLIGPEFHQLESTGRWAKMNLPIAAVPGTPWKLYGVISVGSGVKPGRWQVKFKIHPEQKETKDLRKIEHGMACYSITDTKLKKYAGVIGIKLIGKKTEWCTLFERTFIEKQLSEGRGRGGIRYLYSPFEAPP
jgi:hypothetical protein